MTSKLKYSIYAALIGVLFGAYSCNQLDNFEPEGGTITEEQQKEIQSKDPSKVQANVDAMYANLIKYNTLDLPTSSVRHNDFGYASLCIMLEHAGQDMASPFNGYNWYRNDMDFNTHVYTSTDVEFIWRLLYNEVKAANAVLEVMTSDIEDEVGKSFRGQALAMRAFSYLHLVQMFQLTYDGHENAPAVPIITETTTGDQGVNNPRATVQAVYDLIFADLNEAIQLLSSARTHKGYINQQVAYGLRARANLLTKHWAEAAADAEQALSGGATPYTLSDLSKPAFNSVNHSSCIWGSIINETNDIVQTGILNWPSQLCSFTGNGYTTAVGMWRKINPMLWNRISNTDVRKGWWVNDSLSSPISDNIAIQYQGKDYPAYYYFGYEPYTNVKFGAYQNIPDNTTNASDWIMMRAEEMILIKAEGLAMSGDEASAKTTLENFMKTYRDPSYTYSASNMRDEIWLQRRIELWGEGFAYFDVLRLKKGLERVDSEGNSIYPSACKFNVPAESPYMIWPIPRKEIDNNAGISQDQNNQMGTLPKPQ